MAEHQDACIEALCCSTKTLRRFGAAFAAIVTLASGLATPRNSLATNDRPAAANAAVSQVSCDESLAAQFKPNPQTTILATRVFRKGDPLPKTILKGFTLPEADHALADLCLVKVLVGPGHAGPAGAPSTSTGIGIEVWLPTKPAWNGRVHAIGGGGWAGS